MLIYFAVVTFPLLVGSIYNNTLVSIGGRKTEEDKKRPYIKLAVLIAALPMFYLIGNRHESIGPDTYVYVRQFLRFGDMSWDAIYNNTRMESGYLMFVKLITYITDNPVVYQSICAAIYLLGVTSFVSQLETEHFFVLFLFGTAGMYLFMFTGVRQCIAISICLLSYKYIKKRKIIPFIILILLATQFHRSSIIFIAAYFIYPIKLSATSILSFIGATFVALVFMSSIQGWFAEQLDYEGYVVEGNAGGLVFAISVVGMIVFSIIFAWQSKENTTEFHGMVNIGMISAIFWVVRIFNRVAERPSYYFFIFVFGAVGYAVGSFEEEKEKVIAKYIIIGLALALFYYRLSNNSNGFIPYRMFEY